MVDADRRIRRINTAAAALLGCGPAALLGLDLDRAVPALALPALQDALQDAMRDAGAGARAGRPVTLDDAGLSWRAVRCVHLWPLPDGAAVVRLETVHEAAAAAERSPDVITRYDRDLRISYISPAIEHRTGHPPSWFIGRRMSETGLPATLTARWEERLREVLRTGEPRDDEFAYEGPEGPRQFIVWVVPERDLHGAIDGIITTTRDVTERRRAELAALEEGITARSLLDQSLSGIYVIRNGRFVFVNRRFAEIFDYTPEELLALPEAAALVDPDDIERVRALIAERLAGRADLHRYGARARRRDGTTIHVEAFGRAAEYRGERAIIGTLLDVTEQRRAEEREQALEAQLRHSQKLEALGQLAAGIAHDFNNILAAITGYAQLLRDASSDPASRRRDTDEILAAAGRAATITRQLLAFGRHQALAIESVDLTEVVRATAALLRPLLPAAIRFEAPGPAAAPVPVCADRGQLAQVVMNLALNARDAMPEGGELVLRVSIRHPSGPNGPSGLPGPAGATAVLTVCDTGTGMTPEVRARIFEPFFTTKGDGRSSGLGLATVYGIVRQSGGTIEVTSEAGRGSEFAVLLPIVAPAAAPIPAAPAPAPAPTPAVGEPRRTLLLVEDESALRRSTCRLLERSGFEVLTAAHGGEGLAALAARGGMVDVVLTDEAMPGGGGRELATAVAARYPAVPVILMSGYTELAPGERGPGAIPGVMAFLEKPFTVEQLLGTIRRVLAEAAGAR